LGGGGNNWLQCATPAAFPGPYRQAKRFGPKQDKEVRLSFFKQSNETNSKQQRFVIENDIARLIDRKGQFGSRDVMFQKLSLLPSSGKTMKPIPLCPLVEANLCPSG
jgi:hypothetical protein